MPQHITVSDYNAEWPLKFYRESQAISAILTDNCIEIYHIGSTSVKGLSAKPIIDIMLVVKNLGAVDCTRDKFSALGYEWLGENSGWRAEDIFARVETIAPIRYIFLWPTTGAISTGTLLFAIICASTATSVEDTRH